MGCTDITDISRILGHFQGILSSRPFYIFVANRLVFFVPPNGKTVNLRYRFILGFNVNPSAGIKIHAVDGGRCGILVFANGQQNRMLTRETDKLIL